MWVVSVIYPLFLALFFHECFFCEKGTLLMTLH